MNEFETEPVPGLPERLPAGESLLWQGSPAAWPVARHIMHVYAVSAYFAALIVWRAANVWNDNHDLAAAMTAALPLVLIAACALALIALVSRLIARTTIYSITTKRVVMRYGVALPVSVNIPYCVIRSADVRTYGEGSGDIALSVEGPNPLGYYHLWPHARAWRIVKPQPAFRALADASVAAGILGKALHTACGMAVPTAAAVSSRPADASFEPAHAAAVAA